MVGKEEIAEEAKQARQNIDYKRSVRKLLETSMMLVFGLISIAGLLIYLFAKKKTQS